MQNRMQRSTQIAPVEGILLPHNNDVLCGKGKRVNEFPGNQYYRTLVDSLKIKYVQAPKEEKYRFAHVVVNHIHNLNPPGRFLKQNSESETWYEIDNPSAIKKARQALREQNTKIRDNLEKEKATSSTPNITVSLTQEPNGHGQGQGQALTSLNTPNETGQQQQQQQQQSDDWRRQLMTSAPKEVSCETLEIEPTDSGTNSINGIDPCDELHEELVQSLMQPQQYTQVPLSNNYRAINPSVTYPRTVPVPNFLATNPNMAEPPISSSSQEQFLNNHTHQPSRNSEFDIDALLEKAGGSSLLSMLTDASLDSHGKRRSSIKRSSLFTAKDDQMFASIFSLESTFPLDASMQSAYGGGGGGGGGGGESGGDRDYQRNSDTTMSTFSSSVKNLLPSLDSDFSVRSDIFM
jgi:hypothetical protein